jgi:hypothetical protein
MAMTYSQAMGDLRQFRFLLHYLRKCLVLSGVPIFLDPGSNLMKKD